jgi:hypothetical protein
MLLRRFQPLANAGRSVLKMRMLATKSYVSYDDALRTVVYALVKGSPRTIFKFVKGMESKGLKMDTNVQGTAVIIAYISEDRFDEARDYAIKNQSERELEEIFIREIFRRRGLGVGLKYLSQVQSPTASMQGSYFSEVTEIERDPETIFEIVDQMRSRGIVFNEFLYAQIFKVCVKSRKFDRALKERELMKKENIPLGKISIRYLTEIYWKAKLFQEDEIDELCDSFWKMDYNDINSVLRFLSFYLKMNKRDKVEGVFKQMESSGMKLNNQDFRKLQEFCEQQNIGHLLEKCFHLIRFTPINGFKEYTADIAEILFEICESAVDLDEARFAFNELHHMRYDFSEIVRLYQKFKKEFGYTPNAKGVIDKYLKIREHVDAAFEFAKEEYEFGHEKLTIMDFKWFITYFIEFKKLNKVKQVIKYMDQQMFELDSETYRMISAYFRRLMNQKKLELEIYNDIDSGDPSQLLFRCFVTWCVEYNRLHEFAWIIEDYRRHGFDPDHEISRSSELIRLERDGRKARKNKSDGR